jgi:ABC-2 type transport system permease protein
MLVGLMSNALLFVALLFSPINYPSAHLPGWLASLHAWLPFEHMGRLIRQNLTGTGPGLTTSFLAVSAWCAVALATVSIAIRRRS